MTSRSFKASRSNLSAMSDAPDPHNKPPLPPQVTFARKTSSSRYISYSRDDLDSELNLMSYTVHIPPTPDNQPMDPSCVILSCDAKVMSNEFGANILPCECDFKICRDCYIDAVKTGGGVCPGCKELYKNRGGLLLAS